VVVITGAAGGIGFATARLFAAEGWNLALIDRSREALAEAAAELSQASLNLWTVVSDVADFEDAQQAGRRLLERFGGVDVLVNNAGVSQPKHIVDLSKEEWDSTLAVNLSGAFHWSKALLPSMLARRRGKIINVSSMSAKHGGGPGTVSRACYAASKAGLLGFTRGLAREAAPHVQVNAVCPGLIETSMTRELLARMAGELRAAIPLGRLGTPADVAGVIWVLASPYADYLTGEIIDVNGGLFID
jgi:NAD(P)-dependent dehydrogenase (short-subunit alcohol dehydrogenase family)